MIGSYGISLHTCGKEVSLQDTKNKMINKQKAMKKDWSTWLHPNLGQDPKTPGTKPRDKAKPVRKKYLPHA